MSLLSLPTEIISKTCRYLGLEHDVDGFLSYNNDDLKSLRLTCRDLHAKTTFDAAVRYGLLLEELEIVVDHKGLCQLLHLTQIPAFRDRIKRVLFYYPSVKSMEDDCDIPWGLSPIREMRREEISTYLEASETVELLAACFRNVKQATSLEEVPAQDTDLHRLIHAASARSGFARKKTVFTVRPGNLSGADHRTLMICPADCSPYTKGIEIGTPTLHFERLEIKQIIQDAKRCNEHGYHLKGYQPDHTNLSRLVANHTQIETLRLDGCETHPRLRFCDGCHAVFSRHIATIHYSNITRLSLYATYISGGRLRRFIKQHSATLKELDFTFVTLTDGSWRSIAQGLHKLPKLDTLSWAHLFQKHAVPCLQSGSLSEELKSFCMNSSTWEGTSNVKYYLQTFLESFCMRKYYRNTRGIGSGVTAAKTLPSFHEVIMYRFADVVMEPAGMASAYAIQRYAEEILN